MPRAGSGRTVQLKVRYAGFRTITRSRTLREATDLAADIAAVARGLLRDVPGLTDGVRLIGVSMQQLSVPALSQPDLFGSEVDRGRRRDAAAGATAERQALERTVDAVRARFGNNAVGHVSSRVEQTPAVRENENA